jgi:hypothetical protein
MRWIEVGDAKKVSSLSTPRSSVTKFGPLPSANRKERKEEGERVCVRAYMLNFGVISSLHWGTVALLLLLHGSEFA